MLFLTGGLLGLVAPAHAAELSLEEALRAAVEGNQAVRNAQYAVESADGSVMSAQATWEPRLDIAGNGATNLDTNFFGPVILDQGSNNFGASANLAGSLPTGTSYSVTTSWGRSFREQLQGFNIADPDNVELVDTFTTRPQLNIGLTQDVLRGHRWAYNRRQLVEAQTSRSVAELQLQAQEQRTLRDVATSYWAWWFQGRAADIANDRVEVASEALRVGELQLKEGRVAPVDVSRLRTELIRARKTQADSTQLLAEQRDNLLLLIGQDPGSAVEVSADDPPAPASPPTAEAAMQSAREGNPDLLVARQQAEQAELSLKMAKHGLLPSLRVNGDATFSQVSNKVGDGDPQDANNRNLSGSATLSLPLGNRAARGEVARAAATEAQRRNDLAAQERTVLSNVAKQARLLQAADLQIELADQEAALAEETLKAEEARAEVGRSVQRDVLEARVAVFDARLQAAKARSDRQLAYIELLLLQGDLDIASATGKR